MNYKEDVSRAVEVLSEGGVIIYPTDTIWGIGCDATNPSAVEKIYKIKQRTDSKAMLVLMDTELRLEQYIEIVPEIAWQLIEAAVEPLTIIYPGARNFAPNLCAEDGSIGIRLTEDKFCVDLIRSFRKPIVSTSANISGEKAPGIFAEIKPDISENADYVLYHRRDEIQKGRASGIIKLGLGGEIEVLRK